MQIENEFTVPAPIDEVWSHLLDVERVAPCMPGAELTESVDESTWKGKVNMRLGPVSLSFAGIVTMEDRDDAAHRVVLRAKGMEQKGKGAANASVTSWLETSQNETTVKMVADVQLTGSVAQLSRGLLPEVSRKLTREFAECLRTSMLAGETERTTSSTATAAPAPGPTTPAAMKAKPISGLRLGLSAIWARIQSLFGSRRA
ncbi:MAG TPA: SRPBCC family protein [Actinomycetota bacterium]|jgi:carbon monoxide dehydrogenase subunit G|nr:SRPBCC family protein [Actinomycetota bacterium]